MSLAMRGDQTAIDTLSTEAPRVLEVVQGMRENISYLQQQLLDSKAIKEGSDLEAKIVASMEDGGAPQLYVTRQYEVFDNPDFPDSLKNTSEGQDVLREVKQYLINQKAIDNEEFAKVLELKRKEVTFIR